MAFYNGNSKDALRAMQLAKKRQQQQEDIEIKKRKIEEENKMKSIDNKFQQHYDAVEALLKTMAKRAQVVKMKSLNLLQARRLVS